MSNRCPNSLTSADSPTLPKLFRDAEHRVRQKILELERVEPSVKADEALELIDEETGIELCFGGRKKRLNEMGIGRRIIQIAFVRIDGVLIKRIPKDGSFF